MIVDAVHLGVPRRRTCRGCCSRGSARATRTRRGSTRSCSLGRHARRGVARRRARAAARDRRGRRRSRTATLIIFLTFCVDPRDARRAGADAPARDPAARRSRTTGSTTGSRRRRGSRRPSAALARLDELVAEGGVREDTAERHPRLVQLPPRPLPRRASTTATTARSRSARSVPAPAAASCSRPSAGGRRAAPPRHDQRRRDEPRPARPRPRGRAARRLKRAAPPPSEGGATTRLPRGRRYRGSLRGTVTDVRRLCGDSSTARRAGEARSAVEAGFAQRAARPGEALAVPAVERRDRRPVAGRVHHPAVAEVDAGVVDLGRLRLRALPKKRTSPGFRFVSLKIRCSAADLAATSGRSCRPRSTSASVPSSAYGVSL